MNIMVIPELQGYINIKVDRKGRSQTLNERNF